MFEEPVNRSVVGNAISVLASSCPNLVRASPSGRSLESRAREKVVNPDGLSRILGRLELKSERLLVRLHNRRGLIADNGRERGNLSKMGTMD